MTVLLLSTWLACSVTTEAPECVDGGDCTAGTTCIDETCQQVDCLSSTECELSQYCDSSYECRAGCMVEEDCPSGQTCDEAALQCVDSACRTSDLDCNLGERCNVATGACIGGGDACTDCSESAAACGTSALCVYFEGSETERYCYDYCDRDQQCPAGFSCSQFEMIGGGSVGLCYADCAWLQENDWL